MITAQQKMQRPMPGVMRGLTHDMQGAEIIRPRKTTKVGIGIPKGRAILVSMEPNPEDPKKLWCVRFGKWEKVQGGKDKLTMPPVFRCETRAEAEAFYRQNRTKAAVANRPQKIAFFTFTRKTTVIENGKPEVYQEPDFAAIEAHGIMPKEIEIVLMDDNPLLVNEYAMFSASDRLCYGDGTIGMRILRMASTKDEKELAAEAAAAGEKYFPILTGCWQSGCPYAAEGSKTPCKPSQTTVFQLAASPTACTTAFFSTTAISSSTQISSGIADLRRRARNGLAWKVIKLIVGPLRTNHNGIAALSYSVYPELRAEDLPKMREALSSGWDEDKPVQRAIAAAVISNEEAEEITGQTAGDMSAEFYIEEDAEGDDEPGVAEQSPMATASNAKVADLAAALEKAKGAPPAAPKPAPAPPPAAPRPESGPQPVPAAPAKAEAVAFPWSSRIGMNSAIIPLKAKVGDAEFNRVLRENGIDSMGRASHDDPKMKVVYDTLMQMAAQADSPAAAAAAAPPDDGRLF